MSGPGKTLRKGKPKTLMSPKVRHTSESKVS